MINFTPLFLKEIGWMGKAGLFCFADRSSFLIEQVMKNNLIAIVCRA